MVGGGGSIYFFGSTLMGEEAKCDFLDVFGLLLCIYCVFFLSVFSLQWHSTVTVEEHSTQFQSRLSSEGKCLTYHGTSSILEYVPVDVFKW